MEERAIDSALEEMDLLTDEEDPLEIGDEEDREEEKQQLYTAKELSEVFRVSKATIYRLTKEGTLPSIKIGPGKVRQQYRYRWGDVREALESVPRV